MKPTWLAIPVLMVCLAACSAGVTVETLQNPVYLWGQTNSLCGFTRAVDAGGNLWDANGCENGEIRFHKIGQLSSDNLKKLVDAFANLPAPTEVTCDGTVPPHSFSKRTSTGSPTIWKACASNKTYYDTSGLPEPYLSIALLFKP